MFFYNCHGFTFCLYTFDSSEMYNALINEIWNPLCFVYKELASCLSIIY